MQAALPPPQRIYAGLEDFWGHAFRAIGRFALPLMAISFLEEALVAGFSWAAINEQEQWSQIDPKDFAGPLTGIVLLAFVLSMIAAAFLTHFVAAWMQSPDTTVEASLTAALRRTPAVLFWSVVTLLAIVVGLVFLIAPGIYIALRLFYVFTVAVLTPDVNPIAESWRLTQANLVRPLVCYLVMIAASFGVVILTLIPTLLGQLVGGVPAQVISFGADWVSQALTLGLSAIPALLLYGWQLAEENAEEVRRLRLRGELDA